MTSNSKNRTDTKCRNNKQTKKWFSKRIGQKFRLILSCAEQDNDRNARSVDTVSGFL